MTVALSPAFGPGYQGFTFGGLPLAGGLLYTYLAGTSTPAATYTTSSGLIANTNPIVLGPDGRPPFEIWLTTGQAYLFTLKDALSNLIGTYDNITATDPSGGTIFTSLAATSGSGLVGFGATNTYAASTVGDYLLRRSVMPTDYPWLAKFDGSTDDTTAINACFTWATTNGRGVDMPAATAIVSNLLYGTQTTGAQASAPLFLRGSRFGTVLRAKTGTTGIVFQAWSMSGVVLEDFTVDCSNIAAVTAGIDTTWKPGSGPSQQNAYNRVAVKNYSQVGWVARDNNDSPFNAVQISAPTTPNAGQTALDITAAGGGIELHDVFTPFGIIDITCQNGLIDGGFGHGIRINKYATSLNNLQLSGTQIYTNPSSHSAIWDDTPATAGHYTYGINCDSLQFNNTAAGDSKFNLGLNGAITLTNCNLTGSAGVMFGAAMVNRAGAGNSYIFLNGFTTVDTLNAVTGIKYVKNLITTASGTSTDLEPVTFTSVWTSTGTAPAIGNGSITASYQKYGNRCQTSIVLVAGSTTTFGTGSWSFSLPFTSAGGPNQVGACLGLHAGTPSILTSIVAPSAATVSAYSSGGAVSATVPITWASGDNVFITIDYVTA